MFRGQAGPFSSPDWSTPILSPTDSSVGPSRQELFLPEADGRANAQRVQQHLQQAVNRKDRNLRPLQDDIVQAGALPVLLDLCKEHESLAFEALQLLAYRNRPVVLKLVQLGALDVIKSVLQQGLTSKGSSFGSASSGDVHHDALHEQQHGVQEQASQLASKSRQDRDQIKVSALFLLSSLLAFDLDCHATVVASGLPQLLVQCSRQGLPGGRDEGEGAEQRATPATQGICTWSASCLRNLCHNEANHPALIEAGALEVLGDMMKPPQPPAQRVNAAMAVAILVGQEENNPFIQLDDELTGMLLDVLRCGVRGDLAHGVFWTVWKLLQAIASLVVNEANKALLVKHDAISVLASCVMGRHHQMHLVIRFSLAIVWNLAFLEDAKAQIRGHPGLVDHIQALVASCHSDPLILEVAKGTLFTLGATTTGVRSLARQVHASVAPSLARGGSTSTLLAMPSPSSAAAVEGGGPGVNASSPSSFSAKAPAALQSDPNSFNSRNVPAVSDATNQALVAAAAKLQEELATAGAVGPEGEGSDDNKDLLPPAGGGGGQGGLLAPAGISAAAAAVPSAAGQAAQHVMISYEWGSQSKALALKMELESREYEVWIDLDKMAGSTLEAMALAVEQAAVVIVCVSKKYKESQACRTEAEYAFQQRKKIVPVMMEKEYRPNGWLGALLGTKLWVDMSERRTIPDKVTLLERELEPFSLLIKRGPLAGGSLTSASFFGRNLGSTSGHHSPHSRRASLNLQRGSRPGTATTPSTAATAAATAQRRRPAGQQHGPPGGGGFVMTTIPAGNASLFSSLYSPARTRTSPEGATAGAGGGLMDEHHSQADVLLDADTGTPSSLTYNVSTLKPLSPASRARHSVDITVAGHDMHLGWARGVHQGSGMPIQLAPQYSRGPSPRSLRAAAAHGSSRFSLSNDACTVGAGSSSPGAVGMGLGGSFSNNAVNGLRVRTGSIAAASSTSGTTPEGIPTVRSIPGAMFEEAHQLLRISEERTNTPRGSSCVDRSSVCHDRMTPALGVSFEVQRTSRFDSSAAGLQASAAAACVAGATAELMQGAGEVGVMSGVTRGTPLAGTVAGHGEAAAFSASTGYSQSDAQPPDGPFLSGSSTGSSVSAAGREQATAGASHNAMSSAVASANSSTATSSATSNGPPSGGSSAQGGDGDRSSDNNNAGSALAFMSSLYGGSFSITAPPPAAPAAPAGDEPKQQQSAVWSSSGAAAQQSLSMRSQPQQVASSSQVGAVWTGSCGSSSSRGASVELPVPKQSLPGNAGLHVCSNPQHAFATEPALPPAGVSLTAAGASFISAGSSTQAFVDSYAGHHGSSGRAGAGSGHTHTSHTLHPHTSASPARHHHHHHRQEHQHKGSASNHQTHVHSFSLTDLSDESDNEGECEAPHAISAPDVPHSPPMRGSYAYGGRRSNSGPQGLTLPHHTQRSSREAGGCSTPTAAAGERSTTGRTSGRNSRGSRSLQYTHGAPMSPVKGQQQGQGSPLNRGPSLKRGTGSSREYPGQLQGGGGVTKHSDRSDSAPAALQHQQPLSGQQPSSNGRGGGSGQKHPGGASPARHTTGRLTPDSPDSPLLLDTADSIIAPGNEADQTIPGEQGGLQEDVFVNGKGEQDGADEEEEEEEENPLFWEDVPIEEWTPDLVAQWLVDVRLPEVAQLAHAQQLDGRALCGLHRLTKMGGSLRECVKEDLGLSRPALMLPFIEELLLLFD